ncbi:amino acid adenylation domain-containing protein [Micromonospora sediminicola]|uniref:Amino acid adenylation domain-containing protein n=1 Tax=Micromonospora sediminicola TaxID=946078 RepID=A0A1A9B9W2_9ACTN|nr:non-ribosomal peptide synthetase [Micromonospora sediminicola]SBT65687.1 amino acid adenylation domain-containing protein [Micromonospora sediminicola]
MALLASASTPTPAPDRTDADWRSVVSRFEQVVAAHPDRPALVFGSTVLTFGELARRSAAVDDGLRSRGVGTESLVGLLLPRGVDLVVALLGVLRSGAGYLPLDPTLPAARLRYICDRGDVTLVLSDAGSRRRLPAASARRILTVDTCARAVTGGAPDRAEIRPAHRAYVIYTSGSTGHPKGVEVTHGSLASLVDALAPVVGPAPARVGWNASPSFDASVQQWSRLCRGDTVVLVGDEVRADPEAMATLIAEQRLDELDITPSHLVSLLEHLPVENRDRPLRLLVGGEAVPAGLWGRLAELNAAGVLAPINLYGPTECTVDATYARIDGSGGPHLGAPLAGVQVHLLDDRLEPVPPGGDGELYVAGTGVSRGYLGQPGLTAQRFVPDIVAGDGRRMYRTGDRARIGPEGRLEYLGRRDDQVKLRGYRIELGEIEAVLGRCPGVAQAVAVASTDLPGGEGLVGYCRLDRDAEGRPVPFDAEAVRRVVGQHLPDYMMPSVLVEIDRFPLTRNGKIDRAALPPPVRPEREEGQETTPRSPTERLLAEAWCAVLGVDRVGVDDNFFDIGGQSLLAIRLVALLRRRTGRSVPLVTVFKHPVLRQLAAYLDDA